MYEKKTLPNGVRIVTEHVPSVRSASLGIWVGTGSRHESAGENGAAHFIEHMLFKGTRSRTAAQLAEEMDAVGGQINAFTTKECTCFYARVLDTHLARAADILCDMFFHSRFDDADVETERGVILEEIGMYEDNPEDLCAERLAGAVFKGSPLARPILGRKATLDKMDGAWLRAYQRAHYRPDRIVVGEVRGAECCDMLQAMNTGHDGSLTTLHAGSEQETVVRLTLLARYGIDLPSELIEEQIAMALDGIVMSERHADGRRFVSSYSGVRRAASGGVELERYVTFDAAERTWALDREPPFIAEGLRSGTLTQEEVDEWRSLCPSS